MSNKVTGTVAHIGAVNQITETFKKRDLVLNVQEGQFENINAFELHQDRCSLGDNIAVGEEVTVSYNIKSNEFKGRYYTTLVAWKIESEGTAQAIAPVQQYAPVGETFTEEEEETDDLPF